MARYCYLAVVAIMIYKGLCVWPSENGDVLPNIDPVKGFGRLVSTKIGYVQGLCEFWGGYSSHQKHGIQSDTLCI